MKPAEVPAKHSRILEVHFYEWRLLSWATSDTRDRLDAAGRGIYRELLDQCYAKGSFPADLDYIQRKCACTLEEYERAWPIIKKQFRLDARKNEYRNAVADTFRRSHFSYIETQRKNGARGGRAASRKPPVSSDIETSGLVVAKPTGYENDNPTESLKKERNKETNTDARASVKPNGKAPAFWDERYLEFREKYRKHAAPGGMELTDEDFLGFVLDAWNKAGFEQQAGIMQALDERIAAGVEARYWVKPVKFIQCEWKRKTHNGSTAPEHRYRSDFVPIGMGPCPPDKLPPDKPTTMDDLRAMAKAKTK